MTRWEFTRSSLMFLPFAFLATASRAGGGRGGRSSFGFDLDCWGRRRWGRFFGGSLWSWSWCRGSFAFHRGGLLLGRAVKEVEND